MWRKYNVARYVAYDVSETRTTLLFIVVAVSALPEDLMEASEGVMAPEGRGFGEARSLSPSSKSSSVILLPSPPGPMDIDSRSSSIDVTFRTSLKVDLFANTRIKRCEHDYTVIMAGSSLFLKYSERALSTFVWA